MRSLTYSMQKRVGAKIMASPHWFWSVGASTPIAVEPRTHNKLGDSSFSAAGLRLWKDLPPELRLQGLSFDSLRRSLKTHLFGN